MLNTVLAAGRTAVITGGASGIGLAAGRRFASLGMNVVLADLEGAVLDAARLDVEGVAKEARVLAVPTDVSRRGDVERLSLIGMLMKSTLLLPQEPLIPVV